MKTIEKAKVELTIKRENGKIEKVVTEQFGEIDEVIFDRIKKETAKAGRGEVLEYRNIPAVIEMEQKDIELKEYYESRERIERAMNY